MLFKHISGSLVENKAEDLLISFNNRLAYNLWIHL